MLRHNGRDNAIYTPRGSPKTWASPFVSAYTQPIRGAKHVRKLTTLSLHPSLEGRGQVASILQLSLGPEWGGGGRSIVISHVDHV